MSTGAQKKLASNLIFGLLGAGLVYYCHRNKGILPAIGATAGYSLITKAVSSTIIAALESSHD
jgi:hypothetical protein